MNSETPSSHWSPHHLENEINSSFMQKREFKILSIRPRLCEGEVSKTSIIDRRSKHDPRDSLSEIKNKQGTFTNFSSII